MFSLFMKKRLKTNTHRLIKIDADVTQIRALITNKDVCDVVSPVMCNTPAGVRIDVALQIRQVPLGGPYYDFLIQNNG